MRRIVFCAFAASAVFSATPADTGDDGLRPAYAYLRAAEDKAAAAQVQDEANVGGRAAFVGLLIALRTEGAIGDF